MAVGGTFDVLHRGHEQLLTKSFQIGEKVLIGVTSEKLVKKLGKTHPVQPYKTRVREIRRFLEKQGWIDRGEISPLNDPYGPAATRKNLQALVVTPATLKSAKKLNEIRSRRGLRTLTIRKIALALADDRQPISSTRIRNHEIDRRGKLLQG